LSVWLENFIPFAVFDEENLIDPTLFDSVSLDDLSWKWFN